MALGLQALGQAPELGSLAAAVYSFKGEKRAGVCGHFDQYRINV